MRWLAPSHVKKQKHTYVQREGGKSTLMFKAFGPLDTAPLWEVANLSVVGFFFFFVSHYLYKYLNIIFLCCNFSFMMHFDDFFIPRNTLIIILSICKKVLCPVCSLLFTLRLTFQL